MVNENEFYVTPLERLSELDQLQMEIDATAELMKQRAINLRNPVRRAEDTDK